MNALYMIMVMIGVRHPMSICEGPLLTENLVFPVPHGCRHSGN